MSSRELKTSKFSLVLRTRENSDVFNSLDEIHLISSQKSKYSLFLYLCQIFFVSGSKYIFWLNLHNYAFLGNKVFIH